MDKVFTLSKDERLCSKLVIDLLFEKGDSVFVYPLKFVLVKNPPVSGSQPVQIVFSVPKRMFKHAVDRNLLKRRMREAFRLNKHPFYSLLNQSNTKIAFMLIYVGKEIIEFQSIEKSMLKGFRKIEKHLALTNPDSAIG